MLTLPCLGRRGVAAMEFGLATPILLAFTLFAVDGARALLIQREIGDAALAIAANAGKLSIKTGSNGSLSSSLNYDQMQKAMSMVFAQIPGLNLGNGGGLFPGAISVTLSEVEFLPLCASPVLSGCTAQTPYVLWSSYLDPAYVGGTAQLQSGALRGCAALIEVAQFPGTAAEYTKMVAPTLATGGTAALTAAPQLVVDISYSFTPWFLRFFGSTTFYASANVPPPLGDTTTVTTLDTSTSTGTVATCTPP
jgi:hypothetical protein